MPRLYLVRHAESPANLEHRFADRVLDPPLTERGLVQTHAVAAYLAAQPPVSTIFTSPLRRAQETALPIAHATRAPLVLEEALREVGIGTLDGRADADAWAEHDRVVARWWLDDWDARFPDGESYRALFTRFTGFLARLERTHPDHDLIAVTHGGLLCSVLPRLCTIPGADPSTTLWLGNTAVTTLERDGSSLHCTSWGSLRHLEHTPD